MSVRGVVKPPTPPSPPEPPGKQRYLKRPRALQPSFDGTYERYGPPVLTGLSFLGKYDSARKEKCKALGWAAFEWVLRTEPSLEEPKLALEALPDLASSVDEADALEVRAHISRLADHTGEYEIAIPYQEIATDVRSETVRIADVAFQALICWDNERRRTRDQPQTS